MVELLAGVPGKLKTLLGRFTATRAAALDNLDAAVSSRAPASSAVSSAVLTPARIAYLDNIAAAPVRIKSIQRGTITIFNGGAGTATGTATITAVVMAKTELRLLGWTCNSVSGQDSPRIELTSTTTITATRTTNNNTMVNVVSWELTEYY